MCSKYWQSVGTTDALVKAIDDWTLELDKNETVGIQVILKDFSKAFDRMQPGLLVRKLMDMDVHPGLITLCKDFLSNRKQKVSFYGSTSDILTSSVGVPQGTLAGPLFWVTYVNDLKPPPPTTTVIYADDTTCYNTLKDTDIVTISNTRSAMTISISNNHGQAAVDYTKDWSDKNNMLLNAEKTKVLYVSSYKSIEAVNNIDINETALETVDTAKLLGVTIDSHLTFKQHVTQAVSKARKRLFNLVLMKRYGLNTAGLTRLYATAIRSVVAYAAPAWYTMTTKQLQDMIEGVQRSALTIIMPELTSYEERLSATNLIALNEFLQDQCNVFFTKIADDSDHRLHHKIQKPPSNLRRSARLAHDYEPNFKTTLREKSFFNRIINPQ